MASDKEHDDVDLDELLAESLKDFDKTPSASSAAETSVDATSTKSSDEAPDPLDEALSAEVARKAAEELDQAMNMLAGENPDVFRRLEEFAQGFEASLLEQKGKSEGEESPVAGAAGAEGGGEGGGSVQDKMKKTLEQMQKDAKDIKNAEVPPDSPGSPEEMFKALSGMVLGSDAPSEGADEDGSGIIPMMQQMMKNLLSKDVLYPAIKDIRDKYPDWLKEKGGELPEDQLKNYKEQLNVMNKVCAEFESEKADDDETVKNRRFNEIVQLMQKMQEYGHPPSDLIGGEVPGLDFDPTKLPGLDGGKCAIM
ncbi:peroxisomal biogenesis factor 19-like [Oscarella lobularis]|uniref:peroxisomal biogenesis factor 19-like n=1 Tax=Oscarella lobularis TaxID=121494 RepID=UPI003313C1D0